MQLRLRLLGAVLLAVGAFALAATVALEVDEGLASGVAAHSTCNSGPCTTDQLQRMSLFAGPVTFLLLAGFGLALLKVPVEGERLRAIDHLRSQD